MSFPAITDETITDAMTRAAKVACRPGDHRCLPLRHILQDIEASRTPKGRCCVGWIISDAGRKCWDVWLDLHTGEGRLRKHADFR